MQKTDTSMDEESILKYLKSIRNQKTNTTVVTKQFLEKLTGKQEFTDEQCQRFFESLLRHYIKNEKNLEHMLAVSGLKDGYKEPDLSAAQRRERFLKFLHENDLDDVEESALEKREAKFLSEIAPKLKTDIDSGKINELLSEWIPDMKTDGSAVKTQSTFLQQFQQWMNELFLKRRSTNTSAQKQTSFFAPKPSLTFRERLTLWSNSKISKDEDGDTTPKSNSTAITIAVIVICLLFAIFIVGLAMDYNYKMTLIRVNDKDIPSTLDTDGDTGAESVDDLTSQAQKRIVNIDEPEEYDVEAIRTDIVKRILSNPAYGDMVARGLCDIELSTGETIGDYNPWLIELVEKTDEAMRLPSNQHPRGLERWLEYRKGEGNRLFVTDEYLYDAARLAVLLVDRLTLVGVREWESCENWLIDPSWRSSDYRAEKNSSQVTCPALILQGSGTGSSIEFLIGFSLDDGRLLIYDPKQVIQ